MKARPAPKIISAVTARNRFGQIMRQAKERQDRFVVDKRGEPQVIIMGIRDFIDTIAPEPEVLKVIGEQAKRKGKNRLTMREIQAEIASYRRERQDKNGSPKGRS
jgi:prevent-host-death family protein